VLSILADKPNLSNPGIAFRRGYQNRTFSLQGPLSVRPGLPHTAANG
jgi:hypothetical protein